MGDVSVVKRSARQRSGSAKVRVFDDHMRKEIKRKKLAALEQDNWHEERRAADEDDDEDYNPLDGGDDSDGGTRALRVWRRHFLPCAHDAFACAFQLCFAEVATSGPKRGKATKSKKKQKKDVWNAAQKCKALQVRFAFADRAFVGSNIRGRAQATCFHPVPWALARTRRVLSTGP